MVSKEKEMLKVLQKIIAFTMETLKEHADLFTKLDSNHVMSVITVNILVNLFIVFNADELYDDALIKKRSLQLADQIKDSFIKIVNSTDPLFYN